MCNLLPMFSLKPTQTPPATTQLNGRTVKLIIRRHRRARRITLRWNAIKETVQLGLPPRVAIRVGLNFIEEKKKLAGGASRAAEAILLA